MQSIITLILDANLTTSAGRTIGAAVAAIIVVVDIATFIIIAYLVTISMIEAAAVTIAVVTPRLRKLAVSFASGHLSLLKVDLHFSYLMEPFTVKVVDSRINVVIQRLLNFNYLRRSMNFLY